MDLPGFAAPDSFERFRAKARAFLKQHEDHIAIHKLRMNKALTAADLAELERMLAESGVGGAQEIDRAKEESRGLGLFVRSLVGLNREAAKEALAGFLSGKTLNSNQIEFVDLIVNHLTEHGVMDAALLYESPFTDLTPHGPDGLFTSTPGGRAHGGTRAGQVSSPRRLTCRGAILKENVQVREAPPLLRSVIHLPHDASRRSGRGERCTSVSSAGREHADAFLVHGGERS